MHTTTRRRFLKLAAAAAASAPLVGIPVGLSAATANPYGGFPIGVQSYSLRNFNLHEALRHIHGLDVHYVELFSKHLNPEGSLEEIEQTRKACAAAGVAIRAHGVNAFGSDHEANRKTFDFARRAGIRNITADPSPDSFDSLDKLVDEYSIRVAIHNHGPNHRYNKIEDVLKAVRGRNPLIGACVDTGHFIRGGEDPVKAVYELGDRVFAVHIKDDTFKNDPGSRNVVIGQANLDVVGLFRALKSIRFPSDGALSLEYEANPDNPVEEMRQCLAVAREAIAKIS